MCFHELSIWKARVAIIWPWKIYIYFSWLEMQTFLKMSFLSNTTFITRFYQTYVYMACRSHWWYICCPRGSDPKGAFFMTVTLLLWLVIKKLKPFSPILKLCQLSKVMGQRHQCHPSLSRLLLKLKIVVIKIMFLMTKNFWDVFTKIANIKWCCKTFLPIHFANWFHPYCILQQAYFR